MQHTEKSKEMTPLLTPNINKGPMAMRSNSFYLYLWPFRGSDRMVIGFKTTYAISNYLH